MNEALWVRRPRPAPGSGASTVGRWTPASAAELTAHRRQLAAVLHGGGRPSGPRGEAIERLLLAFEELVSNALRHGRGPVEAVVTATGTGWLLEVGDAAPEFPPVPAVGRDAALGGLGLYLIAQMGSAHGWTTVGGGRKVVWARIDHTPDEAGSDAVQSVPRPRRPAREADRER